MSEKRPCTQMFEIARNKLFSLLPQRFQKSYAAEASESVKWVVGKILGMILSHLEVLAIVKYNSGWCL